MAFQSLDSLGRVSSPTLGWRCDCGEEESGQEEEIRLQKVAVESLEMRHGLSNAGFTRHVAERKTIVLELAEKEGQTGVWPSFSRLYGLSEY